MIINSYRYAAGAGATGLLADYPGASAAFSLRQLISTWTGAVVEVRRSSDSATADFTAAEVADSTLTTWTGANDGFVSKWYDQSGNGFDAIQTTEANQPRIVNSGTLVTTEGNPAIDFLGTTQHLYNLTGGTTGNGNIPYNGGVSYYCVVDMDAAAATQRLWSDDITGAQGYLIVNANGRVQLNDNDTGFEEITTAAYTTIGTIAELDSFHFDSLTGDYEWARDGSNNTGNLATWSDVAIDSSNTANFAIMASGNGNQVGNGRVQELIIYPNDQSANRTSIEGNINTHYTIF
jgi:hypothetical protein